MTQSFKEVKKAKLIIFKIVKFWEFPISLLANFHWKKEKLLLRLLIVHIVRLWPGV